MSPYVCLLSLSLSFLFRHCASFCSFFSPPPFSLCSTVFILLQPPCFCGAVAVVDTMKTGRIHYLASHSSHRLWFALPYLTRFPSVWLSTMNAFFHHAGFYSIFKFASLYFFPLLCLFHLILVLHAAPVCEWLIHSDELFKAGLIQLVLLLCCSQSY